MFGKPSYNRKKVIVVLNWAVFEWDLARSRDSVLLAWQPVQEGANPLLLLSVKVNPPGDWRRPSSRLRSLPSANNFRGRIGVKNSITNPFGGYPQNHYQEGIFVGYRYYTTVRGQAAYEFGYVKLTVFHMAILAQLQSLRRTIDRHGNGNQYGQCRQRCGSVNRGAKS